LKRAEWKETFMTMACLMAMRSSDKGTKVGAVVVNPTNVVLAMGYNGWCRGTSPWGDDDPRHERPLKYLYTEHAERNAIYNSARQGTSLENCTIYVTIMPCMDCARAIVQVGISKVIVHKDGQEAYDAAYGLADHRWTEDHKHAIELLAEAGVELEWWSGKLLQPKAFFNKQEVEL
jgi:dCMP deaminase